MLKPQPQPQNTLLLSRPVCAPALAPGPDFCPLDHRLIFFTMTIIHDTGLSNRQEISLNQQHFLSTGQSTGNVVESTTFVVGSKTIIHDRRLLNRQEMLSNRQHFLSTGQSTGNIVDLTTVVIDSTVFNEKYDS